MLPRISPQDEPSASIRPNHKFITLSNVHAHLTDFVTLQTVRAFVNMQGGTSETS